FFASTLLPEKIGLSTWLSERYSSKKWVKPILSLLDALRIFRHSKVTIVKCLVISFVIQMIIAITCLLIANMLAFPPVSLFDLVIAVGVAQIVALIPIAPGGFGVSETAFANVLTLLNPTVTASYATIFLAYRIISILPYLPGAILFMFNAILRNNLALNLSAQTRSGGRE
ncbi:MAG: flippase-like domain-containing protein, partial [Gammaproteobacteria bacterium]|nr:flippase-like domain-containing protein [Gammaproteobacteria bacterium]